MAKPNIAYIKHVSQQLNSQIQQTQTLLQRSTADLAFLTHTLATMARIYDFKNAKKESDHE